MRDVLRDVVYGTRSGDEHEYLCDSVPIGATGVIGVSIRESRILDLQARRCGEVPLNALRT